MVEIRRAVVSLDWSDKLLERVGEALAPANVRFVAPRDRGAIADELRHCDAALLARDPDRSMLAAADGLRWLHVDHSGVDRFARPELLDRGVVITTSAGRSAPALADHAIFLLLAVAHDVPAITRLRRRHTWSTLPLDGRRALTGGHLVVFGCGNLGREIAVRARAMGMRVTGVRRSEGDLPEFDEVRHGLDPEGFAALLSRADALVLAAPLNDSTHHVLGEHELAALPSHAIVVNIARGGLIDEPALVDALRGRRLRGAGLDVVTHEPLSPFSPLWRLRNVVITPHVTPRLDDRDDRSLAIVERVAAALRDGREVAERITADDLYTSGRPRAGWRHQFVRVWAGVNGRLLARR